MKLTVSERGPLLATSPRTPGACVLPGPTALDSAQVGVLVPKGGASFCGHAT